MLGSKGIVVRCTAAIFFRTAAITKKNFYGSPRKRISNFTKWHLILHMKFSEFYQCFHNSCEIWHSLALLETINYIYSHALKNVKKGGIVQIIVVEGLLSTESWHNSSFWWLESFVSEYSFLLVLSSCKWTGRIQTDISLYNTKKDSHYLWCFPFQTVVWK